MISDGHLPRAGVIMSRVHPPMRFLLLLPLLLSSRVSAADFCAVEVRVISPTGEPARAPVALVDPEGRVLDVVVSDTVRFCDFGFGEHSLRIGRADCGLTTLHNIRLKYGAAQTFTVVWNDCPILGDELPLGDFCATYLRISSEEGQKLGSARAVIVGERYDHPADQYGRIILSLQPDQGKDVRLSAPGYSEKSIHVACKRYEMIENAVQMNPLAERTQNR